MIKRLCLGAAIVAATVVAAASAAIAVPGPVHKPPIHGAAASAHSSERGALVQAVDGFFGGLVGGRGNPCAATRTGIAAIREAVWLQTNGAPTAQYGHPQLVTNGFLPTFGDCSRAVGISAALFGGIYIAHYPTVQAVNISGDHASVRVAPNWPQPGRKAVTGGEFPVSTSWLLRGGKWLFDDKPIGPLSLAGLKAASRLRAALIGHTVTVTLTQPGSSLSTTYDLCTDGTDSLVITVAVPGLPTYVSSPKPGLWYVAGGIRESVAGRSLKLVQARHRTQGVLFSNNASQFDGPEANVKLLDGAVSVSYRPLLPSELGIGMAVTATLTQGATGCS